VLPAEREDPKIRSLEISRDDLLRQSTISLPTAPVAPTTPTVTADMEIADAFLLDMVCLVVANGDLVLVAILWVGVTKDVDGDGLNPNAVDAVETPRRSAAVVLNFIGGAFSRSCFEISVPLMKKQVAESFWIRLAFTDRLEHYFIVCQQ